MWTLGSRSDHAEGDLDVASGGVRVGAHLVGGGNQLLCGVLIESRGMDVELHRQAEPAAVERAEGDAGGPRSAQGRPSGVSQATRSQQVRFRPWCLAR